MAKFLRDKKGQIRIIEAFLSMLVLFAALAICSALSPPSNNSRQKTLTLTALQVLVQLDERGELDKFIENESWAELSEALRLLLPVGVSYNLTVFDEELQQLNNVLISRGYLEEDVASAEYICVSRSLQGRFYILRLQLAVVK
ncbi:MAG: hypothetical protein QW840_01775 [Candidatus Bathyarchaeia archaeon]